MTECRVKLKIAFRRAAFEQRRQLRCEARGKSAGVQSHYRIARKSLFNLLNRPHDAELLAQVRLNIVRARSHAHRASAVPR